VEKFADGSVSPVLFDNQEDPFQMVNLAGVRKGLVQELQESELRPWLERTRDPWINA
jgi:hypothetical protein